MIEWGVRTANWIAVLKDWQTLVTGIIALIAAWWTVRVIKTQIGLQKKEIELGDERREADRQRKSWAVRAQMPDALGELVVYASGCFKFLNGDEADTPPVPSEAITVFKNSIEFIDNDTAAAIFELVSFFQVHNARLSGFKAGKRPSGTTDRITDRMYDAVLLHTYASRLFEYARNEVKVVKDGEPSLGEMVSSLKQIAGLARQGERYAAILAIVSRRHPILTEADGPAS
ncbi:hypothetical protein [Mesorhizobium sp. M0006]|uniref:hypothetical protein n=1 Tax=unclassified Mesorhizobium TaxID=325217 RepID=UPI003339A5E1